MDLLEDSRDEVAELEKLSTRETRNIVAYRWFVTLALCLTGISVSSLCYFFLEGEQDHNFRQGVSTADDVLDRNSHFCASTVRTIRRKPCRERH